MKGKPKGCLLLLMRCRITVFVMLLGGGSFAQQPKLSSPLEIPIEVSGNFGELRSNHFHTGLDIRTQGRTGLPVKSILPGYVSRIKVSEYGYGKALYITHPGGRVSVYAHLEKFAPDIEAITRKEQNLKKSFAVDFSPEPGAIQVNQDELIGYSGNSGSSGGPHLHFEIRNQYTEHPHNPLNYGYAMADQVKPVFHSLRIYPLGAGASVKGKPAPAEVPLIKSGDKFVTGSVPIKAYGKIGIAVKADDKSNVAGFTIGLYKLTMLANGVEKFTISFDSLAFETNRAINAYLDHEMYCTGRERYQRVWKLAANPLTNIITGEDRAVLDIKSSQVEITLIAADHAGNKSICSFTIVPDEKPPAVVSTVGDRHVRISPGSYDFFQDRDIWVQFGENTFYEEQMITYTPLDTFPGGVVKRHVLHNACVPVHTPFQILLKIPDQWLKSDRLVMIRKSEGKYLATHTGVNVNGYFQSTINGFGELELTEDIRKPVITLLSAKGSTLVFKVEDDLTGIGRYEFFSKGNWVLSEYDPRSRTITIQKSDVQSGAYRLVVFDGVNNMGVYEGTL